MKGLPTTAHDVSENYWKNETGPTLLSDRFSFFPAMNPSDSYGKATSSLFLFT